MGISHPVRGFPLRGPILEVPVGVAAPPPARSENCAAGVLDAGRGKNEPQAACGVLGTWRMGASWERARTSLALGPEAVGTA